MENIAAVIGYLVMLVGGGVALTAIIVLSWAFFPFRFQWSRDLPSHLETPRGPMKLNALVGFGSRRRARWFVGFMLLADGKPARARVLARKPALSPTLQDPA